MTKEKLANRGLAAVERHEAKPFPRFWRHECRFSRRQVPFCRHYLP